MTVMLRCMQYSSDHHCMLNFVNLVDDAVRESIRIAPADILSWMAAAINHWIFSQPIQDRQDFLNEFISQALAPGLIPISRCLDIIQSLKPCHHSPVHDFARERKRVLTSSSGIDELGSARCAARRASTSASSASDKGVSSSSMARRISNCRCSNVSEGNSSST